LYLYGSRKGVDGHCGGSSCIAVDEEWFGTEKALGLVTQSVELPPATVIGYGASKNQVVVGGAIGVRTDKYRLFDYIRDTLLCRKKPLAVYPNPVLRGASVTLSMRIDKQGDYMIQLINGGGGVVELTRMVGVDRTRTELMNIPGTLAAGVYFVRVFNLGTGQMYTEKVVVI
jgi:hypothetical protein